MNSRTVRAATGRPRRNSPANSGPDGSDSDSAPGTGPETVLPSEEQLEERAREFFAVWQVLDRLAHVEVVFNSRLRTTAGRAHLLRLQIQLNPRLLARVPEHLDEVLAHEAAHLATGLLHGRRARQHGSEWARMMAQVGYPSRARHDFPLEGLRNRRSYYLHLCGGCGHRRILGRRRARRGCACPAASVGVYRAPRTREGLEALRRFRV